MTKKPKNTKKKGGLFPLTIDASAITKKVKNLLAIGRKPKKNTKKKSK